MVLSRTKEDKAPDLLEEGGGLLLEPVQVFYKSR